MNIFKQTLIVVMLLNLLEADNNIISDFISKILKKDLYLGVTGEYGSLDKIDFNNEKSSWNYGTEFSLNSKNGLGTSFELLKTKIFKKDRYFTLGNLEREIDNSRDFFQLSFKPAYFFNSYSLGASLPFYSSDDIKIWSLFIGKEKKINNFKVAFETGVNYIEDFKYETVSFNYVGDANIYEKKENKSFIFFKIKLLYKIN